MKEFNAKLEGHAFLLKNTEAELTTTAKFFAFATMGVPELKKEILAIKSTEQAFKSRKIRFLPDGAAEIESEFAGAGKKMIDILNPDLNGKTVRRFSYRIESDDDKNCKIVLIQDDGSVHGTYICNQNLTAIKTNDVFLNEIYISTDGADESFSNELPVADGYDVPKAANWYMVFSPLTDKWSDDYGERMKDIRYGEKERNLLDIYIPANLDTTKENGIFIAVHGGGWTGGDKSGEEPLCTKYAKQGYITAAINYSYISLENNSTMFAILDEVIAAIAKIKALSDENGWNITKAALFGGSAGAHISLMHAYSQNDKGALPVLFVAEQVGPIDMRPSAWENLASSGEDAYLTYAGAGTGNKMTMEEAKSGKYDKVLNAVSPITFVRSAVPTILAHGLYDGTVNPQNGRTLSAALESCGVKYDYFEFPSCNHFMACDRPIHEKFHKKIEDYLKEYFGY